MLALPSEKLGRSAQPMLLTVDAQSVKNTGTAGYKVYDAGKKSSGVKSITWGWIRNVCCTPVRRQRWL